MKIAIDLTALAFNFSGIERYALNIAYNMLQFDKDSEFLLLFCNAVHESFKSFIDGKRIKAYIINANSNKISKLILFQISLPKELKKIQADKYVFLAFAPPISFKQSGMIDTIHDIGYFDCPGMWKWYITIYGQLKIRSAINHCEKLVSVSEFTKNRLINRFNYSKKTIEVIYNAIDDRFNDSMVENANEIKIKYHLPDDYYLCLSTLEPRKNLTLLIKAYDNLVARKQTQRMLVLAGRKGWKTDNLLKDISVETRNNIIFTGFVDDVDLPAIYKLAHTFIFPSVYEGFGIPPLEAIACGTRTIVSNLPVFKETLGNAVLYFNNNDCESLEAQLLSEESIEKKIMKNQANLYSWETSAKKYIDVIHQGS